MNIILALFIAAALMPDLWGMEFSAAGAEAPARPWEWPCLLPGSSAGKALPPHRENRDRP